MKNTIYKYLIPAAAALMTAVSCDLNEIPSFNDADAFAAFDVASVSVNEDKGTVSIPVTIASVEPRRTMVTYEVVDGTAKLGTNYSLTDESAVLSFDGTVRTQEIVININDIDGSTGNLTFTVNLISAGGLNLGAESTCTVTIVDLDHPLASILGDYTATGTSALDGASESWMMTFMSDPDNDNVVWIDGIIKVAYGYPEIDWRFYGNVTVDDDGKVTSISLPCGQSPVDPINGNVVSLWLLTGDGKVSQTGTVTMTPTASGFVVNEGYGVGYSTEDDRVSVFGIYNPGVTLVKVE